MHDWMARLRLALFDAVTEADVQAIAKGLVDKAKSGDLAATKLLMSYLVGSPSAASGGTTIKNFGKLTLVNEGGRPKKRTSAVPGTNGKLEILEQRARNGEALFHEEDGPEL